jgi:hypothetical protein
LDNKYDDMNTIVNMSETGTGMKIPNRSVIEGSLSVNSASWQPGRLHLNELGVEADRPAQAVLVPGRRQPLVSDRPEMVMLRAA